MESVEVAAGTIEYQDGGGDGPVVVLLHGLMMDGTLWRHVVPRLEGMRCVVPVLPLGGHRTPMRTGADLSMPAIAAIVGELLEALDLRDVMLVMNDWGGAILMLDTAAGERVSRLALCACEAFDNVPPKGAARLLPYLARVPGGLNAAVMPLAIDRLRRLPVTYGPLSHTRVPREVMDGWFGPVTSDAGVRRDLRSYVLSSAAARAQLLAGTLALARFDRPALVAWAADDRLMPAEHGPRLAGLLPQGQLKVIERSRTLIPEDQPEILAGALRELSLR